MLIFLSRKNESEISKYNIQREQQKIKGGYLKLVE